MDSENALKNKLRKYWKGKENKKNRNESNLK